MLDALSPSLGLVAPPCLLPLRAPTNLYLRGGQAASAVSLANYAAEASGLFGNMGGTAAFIAGGLVPLSSFAAPKISPVDSPSLKRLKRVHALSAVLSLVCNLIAVMYATMARNMLAETAVAPTASLKALLVGQYALPWTGCNAHFILGLFGFAITLGLNVWLGFGGATGRAVGCAVSSAVLLMVSIVNDAVRSGDAQVGSSILGLFTQYYKLLFASMVQEKRLLVFASVCLCIASLVLASKAIFSESGED